VSRNLPEAERRAVLRAVADLIFVGGGFSGVAQTMRRIASADAAWRGSGCDVVQRVLARIP